MWYDKLDDRREHPKKVGADVELMHRLTRPEDGPISRLLNGGDKVLLEDPPEKAPIHVTMYEDFQLSDRVGSVDRGLVMDLAPDDKVIAGMAWASEDDMRFWLPMVWIPEQSLRAMCENLQRSVPSDSTIIVAMTSTLRGFAVIGRKA